MAATELSAEGRAERHADKANGRQPAGLRGGQLPLSGQGGHDERDQANVHGVHDPTQTGYSEEAGVLTRHRKVIEALIQ